MLGANCVSPELQGPVLCSPASRAIVQLSTAMKAGAAQDSGIPLALKPGHCSLHFWHVRGSDHPRIWLVDWFCAPELYIEQQTEQLHRPMWGTLAWARSQPGTQSHNPTHHIGWSTHNPFCRHGWAAMGLLCSLWFVLPRMIHWRKSFLIWWTAKM